MKTLSIDIESYSSVNLSKSGIYRYVESPDFEILLFGYSMDDGEVQVIDLASGEKLPGEVIGALTDEAVTKWAFNANFERICLSRFLGLPTGKYIDPASWRCSMIWAATMGLPLSLEGVGSVLKLDKQKLTEGKELIKFFCQLCAPTKSNGQRIRNYPYHAPDKWSAFKKYNVRDVETEISIQEKLAKFPVPDSIWDEYHLDQEINDRGVALDMTLVREAIAMDSRSRSELTTAMKYLTELENPNSVQQMKLWLADNGMETDTLDKKAVIELLKTAPPDLADVLSLRQQLSMRCNGDEAIVHGESAVALCGLYVSFYISRKGRADIDNRPECPKRLFFFFNSRQCFVGGWVVVTLAVKFINAHIDLQSGRAFCPPLLLNGGQKQV